jgi:hypothetical protein
MRLVFFLVSCTLIGACTLAYPTHERDDEDASVPDTAPVDSGPKCKPPGHYCGNDKLVGDPNTLYVCVADAAPRVLERCEAGCVVAPPGTDDYCK